MSFDKVQDEIIDLLSGDSEQQFIFLTGAAGTGKTTLLERVKNQLSLKKMVVAPTGIAALNIGGTTINSAFRIGFETIPLIVLDPINIVSLLPLILSNLSVKIWPRS